MNTVYPRRFSRWLGPWHKGKVMSIAGDETMGETVPYERDVWLRTYMEESHCGTPGCCEMEYPYFGPWLSGLRVMEL